MAWHRHWHSRYGGKFFFYLGALWSSRSNFAGKDMNTFLPAFVYTARDKVMTEASKTGNVVGWSANMGIPRGRPVQLRLGLAQHGLKRGWVQACRMQTRLIVSSPIILNPCIRGDTYCRLRPRERHLAMVMVRGWAIVALKIVSRSLK